MRTISLIIAFILVNESFSQTIYSLGEGFEFHDLIVLDDVTLASGSFPLSDTTYRNVIYFLDQSCHIVDSIGLDFIDEIGYDGVATGEFWIHDGQLHYLGSTWRINEDIDPDDPFSTYTSFAFDIGFEDDHSIAYQDLDSVFHGRISFNDAYIDELGCVVSIRGSGIYWSQSLVKTMHFSARLSVRRERQSFKRLMNLCYIQASFSFKRRIEDEFRNLREAPISDTGMTFSH